MPRPQGDPSRKAKKGSDEPSKQKPIKVKPQPRLKMSKKPPSAK